MEKLNYKIEFAEQQDVQAIADLYRGWEEFIGILPAELCQLETADDLMKYFQKNSPRIFIIAKTAGKIVGVCYLDISWQSLKTVRLGDMFIAKDYRSKGIGSALIDKTIDYAKHNNIKKIWLWTQEELKDAIRLYKKKGFRFEGTQKSQFCDKDALLYGLVL